jgi:hypothetical protein
MVVVQSGGGGELGRGEGRGARAAGERGETASAAAEDGDALPVLLVASAPPSLSKKRTYTTTITIITPPSRSTCRLSAKTQQPTARARGTGEGKGERNREPPAFLTQTHTHHDDPRHAHDGQADHGPARVLLQRGRGVRRGRVLGHAARRVGERARIGGRVGACASEGSSSGSGSDSGQRCWCAGRGAVAWTKGAWGLGRAVERVCGRDFGGAGARVGEERDLRECGGWPATAGRGERDGWRSSFFFRLLFFAAAADGCSRRPFYLHPRSSHLPQHCKTAHHPLGSSKANAPTPFKQNVRKLGGDQR